jgi:xylulokinase
MKANGDLLIALDLGTSAIKIGLFTPTGALLRVETREQKLIFLEGGKVEQSPEETWNMIADGVRCLMVGQEPASVKAIALSLQRGSVVPLSADGNPLSNLIVWMDKRGLPIADQIREELGNQAYYGIAGHPISYITGMSKVLWIHRYGVDILPQVEVIAPPETLFLKWLGCDEFVCSDSTGTYLFPFDIHKKHWSEELAGNLQFPVEKLPKLVKSVEVVGQLSKQAASEFGLVPGIPLVPGGGDGQCAAVGCGVVQPGLCMINIGTATGVQTFLPQPVLDVNCILNCAAHVVPDAWEMEGHTQCSGAVFRWLRDEFGAAELAIERNSNLDAFDLLVDQAMNAPPGADGLLFLPTFNGSTAPVMDQTARGALLGLGLNHSRSHVIRAVLEGISLEIRSMVDAIVETGVSIDEIRLVGGGAKNQHWNQIHADIINRPVKTVNVIDAALVGAAICAAVAIGEYDQFEDAANNFIEVDKTIEPNLNNYQLYQNVYDNYQQSFKVFRENGLFKKLQEVGR